MNIKYLKAKIMLFNFYFINFFEILTFEPLKKQISNAAATTITTTAAAYFFAFLPMLMVRILTFKGPKNDFCSFHSFSPRRFYQNEICCSYFKYGSINMKIRYLKAKRMLFHFLFHKLFRNFDF